VFIGVDVNGSPKKNKANTMATMIAWLAVHARDFVDLRVICVVYHSINARTPAFLARLELIARTRADILLALACLNNFVTPTC
jgi:hypothetical protein